MFDWQQVRRLYVAGEYAKCRELLQDAPNPQAAFWLSRMDGRQSREPDGIARLSGLQCDDEQTAAERDVLLASVSRGASDFSTTRRLLDRALRVLKPPSELFYRGIYIRALMHLQNGDFDLVEPIVETMLESSDGTDRAQAHAMRAWVAVRCGDMPAHIRWMLGALNEYLRMAEPDQYGLAHTVLALGVICREVSVPDEMIEKASHGLDRVSCVDATGYPLFQSLRAFGWAEALRGDEMSALRRWRQAEDIAPSKFWRVFCIVDRAYLAQAMGREPAARDHLHEADVRASQLTWSEPRDEERLILLTIAQLLSAREPARAEGYLARFRSLPNVMQPLSAWHGDRRSRALQLYPHAVALMNLGEPETAIPMLEEAWTIFTEADYGWRAALAALDLHKATSEPRWLDRAREQIAPWPRSWIARDVRNTR